MTKCKAVALFYVFIGSDSTSFMFKVSNPAACWCTVQFATIVDTPFQASTGLKELAASLSVGCTKTNLSKPMMFDLVRMRLFSQTARDVERIPQLRILLINISKGVSLKRVSGQQPTRLGLLPFGLRCPSPRMYSTCMWSALAQLPALSANAWRQSWSVHISASAHARSSCSITISNRLTDMYIGILVIFLLNALFKDLFQAIV